MKYWIMCAALIAVPAVAEIAVPTTGPQMRAAFPNFNIKTNQASWRRDLGQGPKGVFAAEWAKYEVRVSPRALVPLGNGLTGLIVGGTRIEQGTPNDCHACSGMLSLIPMRMQAGRWMVAGLARDLGENGDWGNAGSVTPTRIAGAAGLVAYASGGGQGYSVSVISLWKFAASGAGTSLTPDPIQVAGDTSGVVDGCDGRRKLRGRDCYSIDGRWTLSPANGDLSITWSGMRNGAKVAGKTVHRLRGGRYSLVSGRSPLPEV